MDNLWGLMMDDPLNRLKNIDNKIEAVPGNRIGKFYFYFLNLILNVFRKFRLFHWQTHLLKPNIWIMNTK